MNKQYYHSAVLPELLSELKLSTPYAVPRITKVVINMGVTDPADPRARAQVLTNVAEQLSVIAGQKAMITKAKKSISTFKLRQGDPVGAMVTLRGDAMWSFLERLVVVALPRVKDFRGTSRTAFDSTGNYSLGLEEQIIFPEINYDTIERIRSLQITICTTAGNPQDSFLLLEKLGMPFAKEA